MLNESANPPGRNTNPPGQIVYFVWADTSPPGRNTSPPRWKFDYFSGAVRPGSNSPGRNTIPLGQISYSARADYSSMADKLFCPGGLLFRPGR